MDDEQISTVARQLSKLEVDEATAFLRTFGADDLYTQLGKAGYKPLACARAALAHARGTGRLPALLQAFTHKYAGAAPSAAPATAASAAPLTAARSTWTSPPITAGGVATSGIAPADASLGATPSTAPPASAATPPATGGIFISHASSDAKIGDAISRFLVVCGVPAGQITFTSARTTGVPTGTDFRAHLQSQLRSASIVIELVTSTYLRSEYCLAELGGQWALGLPAFPIRTDDIEPDRLKFLGNVIVAPVAAGETWWELHGRLTFLSGDALNAARWAAEMPSFLRRLKAAVLAGSPPVKVSTRATPAAKTARGTASCKGPAPAKRAAPTAAPRGGAPKTPKAARKPTTT